MEMAAEIKSADTLKSRVISRLDADAYSTYYATFSKNQPRYFFILPAR